MFDSRQEAIVENGALLEAARAGDEEAFGRIVHRQRGMLEAHCHRMLGSPHDAEDAVQETLIRAWRALPRFRGQSSLRTWLHRIATNVCINAIHRRPKGVLQLDHAAWRRLSSDARSSHEDPWSESHEEQQSVLSAPSTPAARYEQREALELAFTVALQDLPPKQRAVLILRDVLGFSAREVAELMESSVASINSALQRARQGLEHRPGEETERPVISASDDAPTRRLVERFASAVERGDVSGVLGLLALDPELPRGLRPGPAASDERIERSSVTAAGGIPRIRRLSERGRRRRRCALSVTG